MELITYGQRDIIVEYLRVCSQLITFSVYELHAFLSLLPVDFLKFFNWNMLALLFL